MVASNTSISGQPLPPAVACPIARFLVGETRAASKIRGTYGIRSLFERCSISVPEYSGRPKVEWAQDILLTLTSQQVTILLTRLVSSEENGGDEPARAALVNLNSELLTVDWQVIRNGTDLALAPIDSAQRRFIPLQHEKYGLANPDFEQLDLSDEEARRLTIGWDEAVRCYGAGAYLATMVMLGSLLEAILLLALTRNRATVQRAGIRYKDNRHQEKAIEKWSLNEMIESSAKLGWITQKISAFAHSLREYRNYVHPELRKRLSELPKNHECLIGSGVISGAVHDLRSVINISYDREGAK